jgi:hypothetical protein
MPDGASREFALPESLWRVFDHVVETLVAVDAVMRDTVRSWEGDPTPGLDRHLAHVLIEIEEFQRDAANELAAFGAFCGRQPMTPDGLRRMQEEARRLRAAQRMVWFGE